MLIDIKKTAGSLLLLYMLFACKMATGQDIAFQHLTVENGLSQNAVLAVSQDSQGFMWIGTSNGLNRYDGYRFKVFQSRGNDSTTLGSNNVVSILEDSKKNMWVGTYSGLNKYDRQQERFTRINSPVPQSLTYNCIFEDSKGQIWAGTNQGLYHLENNTLRLAASSLAADLHVRSITEDRKGNIWLGTTNGLIALPNFGSASAKPLVYKHNAADAQSISSDYITSVEEDRLGRIWIGTLNSGVNMLETSSGKFTRFQHEAGANSIVNNNIRRIIQDKAGRIWIGTQEGLSVMDENLNVLSSYQQNDADPQSLSQNSIHSLYEDAAGTIWAGTYFGGVNYSFAINTDFGVIRKKDLPNFMSNNVISSLQEDDKKNLWIGTEGGGLNYFDRTTGKFTTYKHAANDPASIGSNLIKVVYKDWQGNIWCGTHGGGLNYFEPATQTFKRYLFKENDVTSLNAEVLSIFEDSRGRFWVGYTQGIKLFNKTATGLEPVVSAFTKNALFNGTARYFFEDDKRRLWIASSDGLFVLNNEQITKVTGGYVNCIIQDKKAQIWAGMQQEGLARYDEKNAKLETLNLDGKLSNKNILGILEDQQGNLWLSSDNGLLKYSPTQNQLQVFTVSDGIAGNAFNYNSFFKDSKGEFFFGGFNGITHFFPDKIQSNQKAAHIVLTGFSLFNESIKPGGPRAILTKSISATPAITLRYNQNAVGIEFAVLNFIKSNKNSYAYKLDGHDKAWTYTSVPVANYANLSPGNYTFLVKGANNDGIWSDAIQMQVNILPPFWLTWWAFTLYAAAIVGITFLVVRYFFLGALLKKEEELHQVKLNFFTNISHEIRTHLTLIMAPVDKMIEGEETNFFARQQLTAVKQNANRLLKLVSELMDFRKAETDHLKLFVDQYDMVLFLEDIYNSFRDTAIKKGISLTFIHHSDSIPVFFDKEQLEKVFFNLLANAIRFTPENGTIIMEVTDTDDEVTISVTDNGRGIAPEFVDKVFNNFFQVADHGVQNTGYGIGLALAKNIVQLHHGIILVNSIPASESVDGRTCFSVTLPKGKENYTEAQLNWHGETTVNQKQSPHIIRRMADGTPSIPANEKARNTILIAEDNIELRTIIKDNFKDEYFVLEAANGSIGLEMALTEIPDIVISDVMMPEMDGVELCYRLKTDNRTSHIPVILLTAKSTQNDKVSGLTNGADMYITKPFSTQVLTLNVKNMLAGRDRMRSFLKQQLSQVEEINMTPDEQTPTISAAEQAYLQEIIMYVEDNLDNSEFGVDMLSRHMAMSLPVLYKKIKAITNMSVNDFIKSLRLKKAAQMLQEQDINVNEVATAVGYFDRKYFSQEFKKLYGKTPREFIHDVREAKKAPI